MLAALIAAAVFASAQGTVSRAASIMEDDLTKVMECKGAPVSIMGSRNTLRLDGDCPLVTISGSDNNITIQVADVIKATGDRNKISWAGAKKGTEPTVQNTGTQNQIAKIQQ